MAVMLLEWVFTSAFLILVVLALRAALGKRVSARLRYALWAVVLVRLLVPVQLFTSPVAGMWVFTESHAEEDMIEWPSAPTTPSNTSGDNVLSLGGQGSSAVNTIAVPEVPHPPTVPDAPEPPAAPDLTRAPIWLGWTWLAGSAAVALVFLLSNLRFYWKLRRERIPLDDVDHPLRVYVAVGLPSPCLFGIIRPAVYVTPEAAANPDMLRHVLTHEYTHYRHFDHIWSLLRCVVLAVHWWNPLVWVSAVLSQRDAELACDEGSLKRLGDGERAAYGGTLLALVTAKPRPADLFRCATTMAGDKKSLKERISRIAKAPKRVVWAIVVAVLVTALACVCAFGQAEEQEQNPWPYDASEVIFIRDKGGFGGEFTIRLNQDGSFTCYEGMLSSYIGMGTWSREGDIICLADEGMGDKIKRYYFKEDGADLVFQAEHSAKFLYVDVADGERFSRKETTTVEIAFSHTGDDPASSFYVPEEVLEAAKAYVAEQFRGYAPDGWGTRFYDYQTGEWVPFDNPDPAYFDRVRINNMEGPWTETRQGVEIETWRINYEYHTTMPEKERNRLAGGMYITEDGWKCDTTPNCTYLFFQVTGDERRFLTAFMQNVGTPETDDEELKDDFYAPVDALLKGDSAELPQTDLNHNGVPETLRVVDVDDVMIHRLEVWENGEKLWTGIASDMHAGETSFLLYAKDGEDYLMEFNIYGQQGQAHGDYRIFTLENGKETVVRSNSVERFDYCTDSIASVKDNFDPAEVAAFVDEVDGLLANCTLLVDTGGNYRKDSLRVDLTWLEMYASLFHWDNGQSTLENLVRFKLMREHPTFTRDINRNMKVERVLVSEIDGGQRVELWEDDKGTIWSDEGHYAHVGWNAVFLCTLNDRDYLLRYNPYANQGASEYSYQLFTLTKDGQEQVVRENSVDFDINFHPLFQLHSFDPEAIAAFMDEINGLLANSTQLINTDDNLLSAFEKEGRLYDSLCWLDHWEPGFTRDENKSLLENLKDFQAAMENEWYAETPTVECVNAEVENADVWLSYQGKNTRFTADCWEYNYQPAEQVNPQVLDLNGDGRDEIVFSLIWGHGTGACIEKLYVFDADTLEQYDTSGLNERILSAIQSTGDEDNLYLSGLGLDVTIPKSEAQKMNEYVPVADSICLDNIVRYTIKDGRVFCGLGCDAGGTVNYIGYISVPVQMTSSGSFVCGQAQYIDDPFMSSFYN